MNFDPVTLNTPPPARRDASYQEIIEGRRREIQTRLSLILARSTVFTWELGCGHGHFLTAYAQANPDRLCIGIDIISERVRRAERKRDRARLTNLFFLHAEARLFLDVLPSDASVSELFILFPDPWPKVRHQKHRILQRDFLSRAAKHMTHRSRLYFRTDHRAYAEAARQMLQRCPGWHLVDEEWPFEFSTVFQTRAAQYESLIARHAARHTD